MPNSPPTHLLLSNWRARLQVTTSLACDAGLRAARRSAQDIFHEADAMAADPALVAELDRRPEPVAAGPAPGIAAAAAAPVALAAGAAAAAPRPDGDFAKFAEAPPALPPMAGADLASMALASSMLRAAAAGGSTAGSGSAAPGAAGDSSGSGSHAPPTPAAAADLVASSLANAAAAAANVAASLYTAAAARAAHAAHAAAPLANNIQSFTLRKGSELLSATSTLPPVRSVAAQLQAAAAAGHSTAVATVAAVSAALDSARGQHRCGRLAQCSLGAGGGAQARDRADLLLSRHATMVGSC